VVTGHTVDDVRPSVLRETLRAMQERANHPEGHRLYDYRPDVLSLVAALEGALGVHIPQTPGATFCKACHRAWPCPTIDVIGHGFFDTWRDMVNQRQSKGET
jgi:hypothetical protein